MTKEKAFILALKIVDICKKYNDLCPQCPFNAKGCILTDGANTPEEWRINSILERGQNDIQTTI